MADIVFGDSFDHYTALSGKWTTVTGATISGSNGRYSTDGLLINNHAYSVIKGMPTLATYYIGFAYKYPSTMTTVSGVAWFKSGTTVQVALSLNASMKLQIRSNSADPTGGTLLDTADDPLSPDAWHYIEFMTTVGNSGIAKVYVDEILVIDFSGDTQPSTATNIDAIALGRSQGTGNTSNSYYDDVYFATDEFAGDVRLIYRPPVGAGAYSQWTPSSSVANYSCVDEEPPSTTDYVETDVTDEIDTYETQDLSQTSGEVLAIIGNVYCQKTDGGARTLAMVTRLDSTDEVSDSQAVPSSWGFLQFIQLTIPGSSSAFTVQDSKDSEQGMKLTA